MLTAAYVGSQGRNLFLRSWTNLMTGVTMNQTTGAGIPVLEFGNRFAQIDYKTSGGTDHYDSLQMTAQPPLQQGPDRRDAVDVGPQHRQHRRIERSADPAEPVQLRAGPRQQRVRRAPQLQRHGAL